MKTNNLLLTTIAILAFVFKTHAQTIPSYVPTNGLIAWYPFNGNANDESGNGNNGTNNGATLTIDRFGNAAKAYSFNGTNNRIDLPLNLNGSLINLTQASISGFIKVTSGGGGGIFSNWKAYPLTDPFGFNTGISSNLKISGGNCAGVGVTEHNPIVSNVWTHFAIVFDGNNLGALNRMKIYINGVQVQSDSGSAGYNGIYSVVDNIGNQATNTAFGAWYSQFGWVGYFSGIMDDIGIWNRALTQAEITKLYGSNTTGLKETFEKESINVYPNPASTRLYIGYNNIFMNGYTIKITNSLGKNVYTSSINQHQLDIDLLNLSGSGIYFITTEDELNNIVDVRKVLIQ
ncbi:MAG: T9SS type A sorting domain-containing protein [Bacteroidetes bacterium]|nr:T9SS type A sorting domain-containing protein [Bacteroidota bacterium]